MTLRLVKVIVQPMLVEDDGEHLKEVVAKPVTVDAADWPDYPAKLAAEIASLED